MKCLIRAGMLNEKEPKECLKPLNIKSWIPFRERFKRSSELDWEWSFNSWDIMFLLFLKKHESEGKPEIGLHFFGIFDFTGMTFSVA